MDTEYRLQNPPPQAQICGCLLMGEWLLSLQTERAPGMLQGPQCQCGAWVAWVVAPVWVAWVSLLRVLLSCTRSTIPCSILTPARRASKLFCSLSGHLTHNCDGVWILMWFLYQRHYFCTFATLSPWYKSLTECSCSSLPEETSQGWKWHVASRRFSPNRRQQKKLPSWKKRWEKKFTTKLPQKKREPARLREGSRERKRER